MAYKLRSKGWIAGPWHLGRFSLVISRDDLWIGFCWDRDDGEVYFCPLPMLVFGMLITKGGSGND